MIRSTALQRGVAASAFANGHYRARLANINRGLWRGGRFRDRKVADSRAAGDARRQRKVRATPDEQAFAGTKEIIVGYIGFEHGGHRSVAPGQFGAQLRVVRV